MAKNPSRVILVTFLLVACGVRQPVDDTFGGLLIHSNDSAYTLNIDQAVLLSDEQGNPVSTRITDDTSLGTVHSFDLLPIILDKPQRSAEDGLWRVKCLGSGEIRWNIPGMW